MTEADLIEFCRAGLARFKAPRAVLLVDSLPRTATGKLQRFKVRHDVAARGTVAAPATAVEPV